MLLPLAVLGFIHAASSQDVALCGSLSRDLARCLMASRADVTKDAQQSAAEAAVIQCSQTDRVSTDCRDAVERIHERIACMDQGFSEPQFESDMQDCIGNATIVAVNNPQPARPQQQQMQGSGNAGRGQGGQGGQPSEMDVCMSDRAFQTCMRSPAARSHFEAGFRGAGDREAARPCLEEQRALVEANCPAQPDAAALCPCKCRLVEALKSSCGFPPPPRSCDQICAAAAVSARRG